MKPIVKPIEVRGFVPQVGFRTYVASNAHLIGDVIIGDDCSIWFNVVLRGDVMPIRIGHKTNIQDGTIIHGTFQKFGATIGDRVTVGHGVILHGCEIQSEVLIGMGSIVMDGAIIPGRCIVGAGSLVTEGSQFTEGSLILGRPAKKIRELNEDELKFLNQSANNYIDYKKWYE